MSKALYVFLVVIAMSVSAFADNIVIDSFSQNGSMTFFGASAGTTATVQWAASLTDSGRTNWHTLTNLVIASNTVTTDVPMFFRVVGLTGLVAHYRFEGNATDSSGYGNHGVISNFSFATNSGHYCAEFGGSITSYMSVAKSSSLEPSEAISIAMWCKRTGNSAAGSYGTILRKEDGTLPGYFVRCPNTIPDLRMEYLYWTNSIYYRSVMGVLDLDTWHHIAVTYSRTAGMAIAYFDGVPVNTNNYSLVLGHSGILYIGGAAVDGADGGFKGLIDDARIYNYALSPSEMSVLASPGSY
jgi:hypothetical protein